ncbi:hypothetical protein LQ948_11690 [Jiella sp. MQZ9-1]|uniref:DUF2336 domain-containing protein n=1 Tax=Jiella flava TaxID=2816857 RepID=A0A939FZY9_9HYPH|nr:hypothetical protein [Jiella flava]MBO0663296.1 hypothetical protein [Jiella flava]MCD2471872.1 hypothetical protein [Jiella flava]
MADKMPRIFRTLETRQGRHAFDTIVKAAVAGYLDLRRPGASHSAEFSRLITSTWDKLSVETKRDLAIALANKPDLPRAIVTLILAEPADISAPFLFSSPCLTEHDAALLNSRHTAREDRGARDKRPAATTAMRSRPAARQEQETGDSGGAEAPLRSAAAARDALRALASRRTGGATKAGKATTSERLQPPPAGEASLTLTHEGLMAAARSGARERCLATIAAMLSLPKAAADQLWRDEHGHSLAAALKLLGLQTGDTMSIAMLVHETAGRDITAFEDLRRFFRAITVEDCCRELGLPLRSIAPAGHNPAPHQPLHAEDGGAGYRVASSHRPVAFGRRRNAPSTATVNTSGRKR